jgi:hypothetical protein
MLFEFTLLILLILLTIHWAKKSMKESFQSSSLESKYDIFKEEPENLENMRKFFEALEFKDGLYHLNGKLIDCNKSNVSVLKEDSCKHNDTCGFCNIGIAGGLAPNGQAYFENISACQCKENCDKNNSCKGWHHYTNGGKCWLKGNNAQMVVNNNGVGKLK